MTTPSTAPSYSTGTNTDIAYDFSPYLDRIATALETIATNSTTIATNSTSISSTLSSIKSDLDTMKTNSTTMATLASGTGMHVIGPYDWLGYASLYRLYVEEGKLLDTSQVASSADQATALTALEAYLAKVQSLPTSF